MEFKITIKEEHVDLFLKFLRKFGYKVYCKNGKNYWR